jgi:hypothetical protein
MILVHEDHPPQVLKRTQGESDPRFSLAAQPLTNIPVYDFADGYSPVGSTINAKQKLIFDNQWGDTASINQTFHLTFKGDRTSRLDFEDDAGISGGTAGDFDDFAAAMQTELRTLNSVGAGNLEVTWNSVSTPTASTEEFEIEFIGTLAGAAQPDLVVTNQNPNAELPLEVVQSGGTGAEPVWSSTYHAEAQGSPGDGIGRGWPRSVTFHGSRLWFGGSRSRPSTLWGSNVGLFFDFDLGSADADEAISVTIASDQADAIRHIFSSRYLEIFTSGAEYYIKATPITPETIEIPRQTRYGTSSALRPLNLDGATLFMDGQGRGLRQFLFSYTEEGYQSADLSVLSASLINDPVDLAAQHGVDADYGYVVNGDGTIAVMCTNRFQGVTTWTNYTTRAGDKFLQAESVGNEVFVITKRSIDGVDKYYLEKFDEAYFTDCGYRFTEASATGTWNAANELAHLIGETCEVRSEGPDTEPSTVSAAFDNVDVTAAAFNSKSGTTDMDSLNLEVGFGFDVAITPMTPGLNIGGVVNVSRTRRISQVTLDLLTSKDVYVDGWRVADHFTGGGTGYDPLTGVYDVRILGYSRRPVVRITQESPLEFTLLGVEMEVAV